MRDLVIIISLVCGSWMTIYLYGLAASNSVMFNPALCFFPFLFFVIVFVSIYSSMKDSEKNRNDE